VTARVQLPSETQVRQALTELAAQPGAGPPTVLALARSLGLANGTFWRHFPEIAREVADQRRTAARLDRTTSAREISGHGNPPSDLARLRRANRELTDQIEVAIAHLQLLTLENHTLREELEHSRKIARLPRPQLLPPTPSA
jgi:AcrR family transcriptional regulator